MVKPRTSRLMLILAGLILAAGLGLRIASFTWNIYLKGDINLMALTAREYVQHDRLYYPMIYGPKEIQELATLDPMGMPATQHPPLYPFLAGMIGKLAGTDDTFSLLKLIDEVGGLILLAAVLWAGLKAGSGREWIAAGALVAVSPILVDYSANGSPYILSALSVLLAILLLRSFRMDSLRDYALAGLIAGIGLQFHNVLVGLPVAFTAYWIIERKHIRWAGVGLFAAALALTLVPWIAWNLNTVGAPMYSSSTNYVLQKLGIKSFSRMAELPVALRYLRLLFGTAKLFVKYGFLEAGPFALLLALAGGYFLARHEQRTALAVGLPLIATMAVTLLWPVFKFRFLVPMMTPLIVMAGYGVIRLPDIFPTRAKAARIVGWLLLAGSIGWFALGFLNQPPTRYNAPADETKGAPLYPAMKTLALELAQREPGVVMGLSNSLDSGIETVYWTRLPFILAGSVKQPEAIIANAEKYHIRYIWGDKARQAVIEELFPTARVILSGGPFLVYEIPEGG